MSTVPVAATDIAETEQLPAGTAHKIERNFRSKTIAVTALAATTEEIPFKDFAGGLIAIPTGSTITSLTFYGAPTRGGTYVQIFDKTNTAVARTVAADRAYPLPDECFAAGFLKIVGNAASSCPLTLKG